MMTAFIIGTGRCGSSLLAQMLNSHSKICIPHELQILFEYSDNGGRLYELFATGQNLHYVAADFVALIKERCPHNFHDYFDYADFFSRQHYPILSLTTLANDLFSAIAASRHKDFFIEQTPWYGQRLDILNSLFPEAKYLHIIRDGRDVAISFARTPWWHSDIGDNLRRWDTEVRHIIASAEQLLPPGQLLQVRYEDLVEQPDTELQRICSFLGIDFENALIDPSTFIDYGQYSTYNERAISSASLNDWAKQKAQPTFKGSRYAWKKFTGFDFSKTPKDIDQTLQALGYTTEMPRNYKKMLLLAALKRYGKRLNRRLQRLITS